MSLGHFGTRPRAEVSRHDFVNRNVSRRCLKIAMDGADETCGGEAIQEHERAADMPETLRHFHTLDVNSSCVFALNVSCQSS